MTPKEKRARELAHNAFSRAIRQGTLVREACEHCGLAADRETIHGHHYMGYEVEHRLTVMWLCSKCHSWLHGNGVLPRVHPMTPAEVKLYQAMVNSLAA
jgi:ribosomal protein L37AE/L43A